MDAATSPAPFLIMVSSTRPACGDRLEPVPLMDHHHRPLLNGWRQSNTRRGDGHQEPLDRRGNHPPRGRAPSRRAGRGHGPARTGADRPARTSGCCSSAPSPALYSKRITFQHTFPLPRESRPRTKPTKPTFPIWLNIPLSKSSAFFKPLSICETLAVGMAIITP